MEKINVMIVDGSRNEKQYKAASVIQQKLKVTTEAASGEEAVILAGELRPDVILMDINMPEWTE